MIYTNNTNQKICFRIGADKCNDTTCRIKQEAMRGNKHERI